MRPSSNNPALRGQRAGKTRFYGPHSRFALYPINTGFQEVAWVVADAETLDDLGVPETAIFNSKAEAVAYALQRAAEAEAAEPAETEDCAKELGSEQPTPLGKTI